ncbi:oligosaccharide biosynthesis protein Alg14 [Sphingobium sp. AR-3-1]|uniref:Oligosaccharide biosynthesis protein Alg14 n=1 Tax=Sphingobium psychrophilum TaxID=2728834 RepID=A0A7X9ZUB1_9SPHN|nr:oligosaccharide biosynthesis protein Alg14 [Sphingobium psychrophilum]
MAVASGGGHWVQLLRMRDAFDGFEIAYVSTFKDRGEAMPGHRLYIVQDSSRLHRMAIIRNLVHAICIVLKERPSAIISTGSAPGLAFIIAGRLLGARTLWVDSIANGERLSSSGRIARRFAHRTVSQWPEVAEREGVPCWGSIL